MLLNFILFDEISSTAELENVIKIKKFEHSFVIFENDKEIATIADEMDLSLPCELLTKLPTNSASSTLFSKKSPDDKKVKGPVDNKRGSFMEFLSGDEDFVGQKFTPPEFGVTVLGCSHGFDPKGSTSGYVFWINGRFLFEFFIFFIFFIF